MLGTAQVVRPKQKSSRRNGTQVGAAMFFSFFFRIFMVQTFVVNTLHRPMFLVEITDK